MHIRDIKAVVLLHYKINEIDLLIKRSPKCSTAKQVVAKLCRQFTFNNCDEIAAELGWSDRSCVSTGIRSLNKKIQNSSPIRSDYEVLQAQCEGLK